MAGEQGTRREGKAAPGWPREERMKVSFPPLDFFEQYHDRVFISEDWALPREFSVKADLETGERVEVAVEVTRERVRARRVSIETDSLKGVGSVTLRRLPVRNMMVVGCRRYLMRVNRQPNGTLALMPPGDLSLDDVPVVKPLIENLVGYERLRTEEGSP